MTYNTIIKIASGSAVGTLALWNLFAEKGSWLRSLASENEPEAVLPQQQFPKMYDTNPCINQNTITSKLSVQFSLTNSGADNIVILMETTTTSKPEEAPRQQSDDATSFDCSIEDTSVTLDPMVPKFARVKPNELTSKKLKR